MLKNKKATYILIPLNVLIWGFFAYRFYTAFTGTDEPVVPAGNSLPKAAPLRTERSYVLNLDYKDPFLKDTKESAVFHAASSEAEHSTPKEKQVITKPAPAPVLKQLPDIKYLGLVHNTTSGSTAALVSINGQSRLIKEKDVIDGVLFKSINRDSLVARVGKDRIVAHK